MSAQTTTSPASAYQSYYGPAIFERLSELVLRTAPPVPGETALDVACGTGILTRRIAHVIGHGGRVVGVDLNPAMLEVARTVDQPAGADIEWRHGDGSALDLPDAAFDLVTCQQGLQFFPDRAAGAREMHRVLGDDGRAVVAVWEGLERHPLWAALAEAEVPHLARLGVPVTYDDVVAPFSLGEPERLATLFGDAGFGSVAVVQDAIVARFPDADRFVEHLERAYAAVVPAFAEDPAAFDAYLEVIDHQTRPIVEHYRDGDHVAVPMYTNIVVARH